MAYQKIRVTTLYGVQTRKPYVQIESEKIDAPIQMTPAEARDIGRSLLAAADGAEADAFVWDFFHDHMSQPDEHCAAVLHAFREWRIKRGGQ